MRDEADQRPVNTKPKASTINVSSREGVFEDHTESIGKAGKQMHTNMCKAALNKITKTEAASAEHTTRVAMDTVDCG